MVQPVASSLVICLNVYFCCTSPAVSATVPVSNDFGKNPLQFAPLLVSILKEVKVSELAIFPIHWAFLAHGRAFHSYHLFILNEVVLVQF